MDDMFWYFFLKRTFVNFKSTYCFCFFSRKWKQILSKPVSCMKHLVCAQCFPKNIFYIESTFSQVMSLSIVLNIYNNFCVLYVCGFHFTLLETSPLQFRSKYSVLLHYTYLIAIVVCYSDEDLTSRHIS